MANGESEPRYVRPGWFTNHVFNPMVAALTRAGLKRWKAEVGVFFEGVSGESSEVDLRRIAPDHPVFRIHPPPPSGE